MIRLLTFADARYAPVAGVTWRVMERWCDRHGVVFDAQTGPETGPGAASWAKLRMASAAADDDLLVVLDADVLLLDEDWPPERVLRWLGGERQIAFSVDRNGLCAGAFVARGGAWLRRFADAVMFLGDTERLPRKHEQDAIKALVEVFPSVRTRVGVLPQEVVASQDTTLGETKPWAYHAWAGDWPDLDRLASAMRAALAQPWDKRLAGTLRARSLTVQS